MSFWSRIKHAARILIGGEPVVKALPSKTEKVVETYGIHEIGHHLSPLRRDTVPGGRGPRKIVGFDFSTLRNFARMNPWLRAIIDIRKREVASCEWDIVPRIEAEEKALDELRQLIQSVNRFPDRQTQLDKYKSPSLKRDMVAALIEATRKDDITPSEIRYRFQLALGDISRVARQHADAVRPLFSNPSRLDIGWSQILAAAIPDLLILDAMSIEKRRTRRPEKDGWPMPNNPIVELVAVDGATVRPVLTINGLLEGVDDPEANIISYEQWIDGKRKEGGGWRYCDLLYAVENPQTDIGFRGYGYGRVESLAMSCVLDAHNDKSDLEEFKRQTYGGALVFKQLGIEQQDLDEKRIMFEEELEGTYKIPMFGMPDEKGAVEYVSFSGSPGQRDKKSDQRAVRLLKRMCATFEIPLTKVAEHAEQTNYATSKTTQEQADDGLRKLLGFLDDTFTRNIVDEFGFSDIKYTSSPLHSRDEKAELDIAKQKLELGIWEINDVRMEYGQNPIEEGDLSWHRWSEGQKAMGMGEGQNASMPPDQGGEGGEVGPDGQPVEGGQEGDPNDPEGDGEDLDGDGIEQSDQIEDTQVFKALGGDGHHKPETHANPYAESAMSDMANALLSMWDDMMPEIEQTIAAYPGMGWLSAIDQVLMGKQADIERIAHEHAQKMFGLGAVTAEMGEDAIQKPASLDDLRVWSKDNPGYVSSEAMQYLAASAYTEAKVRQQSIMDDLKRRMIQGIQQGYNPIFVANDFAQNLGDNSYSDYQRLARTEMAKAFAVGALEQAKEYGIDYVYVPENPGACEHCQRLVVGRVFPREALEGATNYGRKVQDWIPALPVHPNCTDHAIPASSWSIQQAAQDGPIPPEGVRIEYVPPSQRGQ